MQGESGSDSGSGPRAHGRSGIYDAGMCDLVAFEVMRAFIEVVLTLVVSIEEEINKLINEKIAAVIRVGRMRAKDVPCCDMVVYIGLPYLRGEKIRFLICI